MSLINNYITGINNKDEKVLSVFLTAGFPSRNSFIDTAKGILDSGADMLEIGIPFSDPLADGPVIQLSSKRALDQEININDCLKYAEILSAYSSKPLIFMGYANPVMKYGVDNFICDALNAGISGLIIPDVPLQEFDSFYGSNNPYKILNQTKPSPGDSESVSVKNNMEVILLTTPASTDERIKLIDSKSRGFVYCVSVTGTTGVNDNFTEENFLNLKRTRSLIKNKMLIGFGISNADDVKMFSPYCDGVIVGSAVIRSLMNSNTRTTAYKLVKELKDAC